MTDDINEETLRDEADYLSFLPGQRLKKAREVRGLSVDEVAKELHLSVRYLNLMEADSYKELPEPAFVRGYMRRYAQLVKLSPDDIAGKFDQCYAADKETPPPDARPYNPIQLLGIITRPRLRLRRLLSWASFALIVVLAVGFLWSGINSRQSVVPATTPELVVPVAPAATAPSPETSAAVPITTEAGAVAAPASAPGMNLLPAPSTASSVAALPATGAHPAPTPAPAVPGTVAVSASAAAPAAPSGPDSVTLALGAESWISVQDAKRQPLLSALRPAGQITLKGEAPFYVNIGKADVVTLVFNGKTVDLKPYTQGSVATLTLKR